MAESKTGLPRRSGWLLFVAGLPGVAVLALLVLPLLLQGRPLPRPLWLIELASQKTSRVVANCLLTTV